MLKLEILDLNVRFFVFFGIFRNFFPNMKIVMVLTLFMLSEKYQNKKILNPDF